MMYYIRLADINLDKTLQFGLERVIVTFFPSKKVLCSSNLIAISCKQIDTPVGGGEAFSLVPDLRNDLKYFSLHLRIPGTGYLIEIWINLTPF